MISIGCGEICRTRGLYNTIIDVAPNRVQFSLCVSIIQKNLPEPPDCLEWKIIEIGFVEQFSCFFHIMGTH